MFFKAEPLAELRALFRRQPVFRQVLLADVIAQLGDGGLVLVLPMVILARTQDVTLTGLAFSGEVAAYALTSPFAGVGADRIEQKRLMVGANLARFLLLGGLLLALRLQLALGWLLAASVALGVAGAFFMPARAAFLRRVLEGDDLLAAIALEGTLSFLTRLIAPALMGLLLALFPPEAGIVADMVGYALASVLMLPGWVRGGVPVRPEQVEGAWHEGWGLIARTPSLAGMLLLDLGLTAAGMAAFSSTVAFLATQLHLKAAANAWLLGTTGLAGALGSQLAARVGRGPRPLAALTALVALSYLLVPQAHALWALMLLWGLRGLAIGALAVLINQHIAREVPASRMGRVNASWGLAVCLAAFTGSVATPRLLRTLGAAGAFGVYGGLLGALALGLTARSEIRRGILAWRLGTLETAD